MVLLDWVLVVIGVAVVLGGRWIQLHPERIYPAEVRAQYPLLDRSSVAQIRWLGACFVFMGAFFAVQMTVDLTRSPWWIGTLLGLPVAFAAVRLVRREVLRRERGIRRPVDSSAMPKKMLEVR